MIRAPRPFRTHRFNTRVVLPAALVFIAAAVLVGLLLLWSTRAADEAAAARQEGLVALVLKQRIAGLAHDQESTTVWDDAVRHLQAGDDPDWIDNNLGSWMHTYFGHDGAFVLSPDNRVVYGVWEGVRGAENLFEGMRGSVMPLVGEVRAAMRAGPRPLAGNTLSPGAVDLAVVRGHPAIISVKPVVSDTGEIGQAPGREFVHVAIRLLDGSFVRDLAGKYWFDNARFSWSDTLKPGEAAFPFEARDGSTIGYFIWTSFLPGSSVLDRILPVMILAACGIAVLVALLIERLRRRSIELEAKEAQAQHLAFHDVLTGLPNRARFRHCLETTIAEARRDRSRFALLALDLDRFKNVNDTLGHPAGDALIEQVGRRLVSAVGPHDTVARLGGDEFAVIQAHIDGEEDVLAVSERIIRAVQEPFVIDSAQVFVGASIGAVIAPDYGLDRQELSRKADIALYHAKASGKGRCSLFEISMDAQVQERRSIERDLRAALDSGGQLRLLYQPVYAARTGALSGVEALVRWHHPQRGPLSPASFIPVAEETGLIHDLGDFVLREACRAAAGWSTPVSVNVSARQIAEPGFPGQVAAILAQNGIAPAQLEIEITEMALLENTRETRPNIQALRASGVRIALDDFGTGCSSLSNLRDFSVDRIKIDRSFVQGLEHAANGPALVRAIVDLARAAGLKVTAEGVETADQRDTLSAIGCDDLQGFYLAKPMNQADADALLRAAAERATKDHSAHERPAWDDGAPEPSFS